MTLKGCGVIVTGGAGGIGRTIVDTFCNLGAAVAIIDIRQDLVDDYAVKLRSEGKKALGIAADVTDISCIQSITDRVVSEFGSLDILVNNAGRQIRKPSVDFTEEHWDQLMDLNLKAVFFWCQAAARVMIPAGRGAIVNISSGNSVKMMPGRAPYCISKAGVNALTAVLGIEWASLGVRVNAVAPGWIKTDMVQEGIRLGVVQESQILSITPIGRLATTQEIADVVAFLCGHEARYIVGQTIFVDGGWSAVGLPDMQYFNS